MQQSKSSFVALQLFMFRSEYGHWAIGNAAKVKMLGEVEACALAAHAHASSLHWMVRAATCVVSLHKLGLKQQATSYPHCISGGMLRIFPYSLYADHSAIMVHDGTMVELTSGMMHPVGLVIEVEVRKVNRYAES